MAGKEAAEGSGRKRMDVGLPQLPPPQVRLGTSVASPALMPNSTGPAQEAPRTGEPRESLAPAAVAYSPSNALSAPEEHPMLDPIVYSWLDGSSDGGEEYIDALEPPAPADGLNVAATGLLEEDDLLVARSVRPSRLAAAFGMEMMVTTSTFGQSTQGAATNPTEAGAPELRFQRVIQISQQHDIVRLRSANHNQEATSAAYADSLARAIQQTRRSFEAAMGQNSGGSNNSSFECNICLEVARQPVVTSCGHLFCWPCLHHWLHAHSPFSECPICKGEVLKGDISPIYGRGGEEEGESTANPDLPPRPRANRRDSLRWQLQIAIDAGNTREMGRLLRQMAHNQNQNQGWDTRDHPAGVVTTAVPAAQRRASAGTGRQQRQVAPESSNPIQLPHSNGDPGPSRRSRRLSESPTIRRTRRRPQ